MLANAAHFGDTVRLRTPATAGLRALPAALPAYAPLRRIRPGSFAKPPRFVTARDLSPFLAAQNTADAIAMIADEATFARLMISSQEGDKNAYTVLLTEATSWLERYFRRRCPPAQLDDLVQEVLMAIHKKRATWDPSRPFMPWMAAIARYRWVDHLRKVYRNEEDALEDYDAPEDSEEEAVLARMSLERLFVHLPEKQVEAIELTKIAGLSVRETAERTGQSESAVKVNIHRGLKKLATLVEKAE